MLKVRGLSRIAGVQVNESTKNMLQHIFNGNTNKYLYLVAGVTGKDSIKTETNIPKEMLNHKFLMQPVRLAMMKILTESPNMINSELKAKLKISWGEINHHLPTMEKQNLILIEDRFVDGIRKTTISITLEGSMQYVSLVEILQEFLNSSESDTYPETLG